MLSRILTRLAVVWFVGCGILILISLSRGGTLERGAGFGIPLVLLGPPAILIALAWVFAPRK